ncbi:Ankyrin repeat and protein kinase domain-containing protein 1 [Hondaea fermentalgiana]|uniref:Ankyrin repeat and protein kinase domain-containing protein 1 n=1 Tax=Hondaea fermentalgiana TaxID=2315210 RepID=A0A2R5G5J9_9STRA|nr:Ankyrin repeat and protein kinase domain-containing protein 1 [Hondaea fermentalgiana]|eukprot:GBG26260.1 Ankyrin repeat and protein kinase domain-containing protein 1 [Hondaea fermentalgiana]
MKPDGSDATVSSDDLDPASCDLVSRVAYVEIESRRLNGMMLAPTHMILPDGSLEAWSEGTGISFLIPTAVRTWEDARNFVEESLNKWFLEGLHFRIQQSSCQNSVETRGTSFDDFSSIAERNNSESESDAGTEAAPPQIAQVLPISRDLHRMTSSFHSKSASFLGRPPRRNSRTLPPIAKFGVADQIAEDEREDDDDDGTNGDLEHDKTETKSDCGAAPEECDRVDKNRNGQDIDPTNDETTMRSRSESISTTDSSVTTKSVSDAENETKDSSAEGDSAEIETAGNDTDTTASDEEEPDQDGQYLLAVRAHPTQAPTHELRESKSRFQPYRESIYTYAFRAKIHGLDIESRVAYIRSSIHRVKESPTLAIRIDVLRKILAYKCRFTTSQIDDAFFKSGIDQNKICITLEEVHWLAAVLEDVMIAWDNDEETDPLSEADLRVIRGLCPDCCSVRIRKLAGGFSGSLVLHAICVDVEGRVQDATVLKLDTLQAIEQEEFRHRLMLAYLGDHAPQLHGKFLSSEDNRGGIKISLAGGGQSVFRGVTGQNTNNQLITLKDLYLYEQKQIDFRHDHKLKTICLDRLQRQEQAATLLSEMQNAKPMRASMAHRNACAMHSVHNVLLECFGEIFEKCTVQSSMSGKDKSSGDVRALYDIEGALRKCVLSPERAKVIADSVWDPFLVASKAHLCDEVAEETTIEFYEGMGHGDLNAANIVIDAQSIPWLIDFAQSGKHHVLQDLCKMTSCILFEYLSLESNEEIQAAVLMLEALSSGYSSLQEPLSDDLDRTVLDPLVKASEDQPERDIREAKEKIGRLQFAWQCCKLLRGYCAKYARDAADIRQWHAAMAYYAARAVSYRDTSTAHKQLALAGLLLHAGELMGLRKRSVPQKSSFSPQTVPLTPGLVVTNRLRDEVHMRSYLNRIALKCGHHFDPISGEVFNIGDTLDLDVESAATKSLAKKRLQQQQQQQQKQQEEGEDSISSQSSTLSEMPRNEHSFALATSAPARSRSMQRKSRPPPLQLGSTCTNVAINERSTRFFDLVQQQLGVDLIQARRVAICGPSSSGKTIVMKKLVAHALAEQDYYMPVLVDAHHQQQHPQRNKSSGEMSTRSSTYSQQVRSMIESPVHAGLMLGVMELFWAHRYGEGSPMFNLLLKALENGQMLLFVDGLDDMRPETRVDLLAWIESQVDVIAILTARRERDIKVCLSQVSFVHVKPLSQDHVSTLVKSHVRLVQHRLEDGQLNIAELERFLLTEIRKPVFKEIVSGTPVLVKMLVFALTNHWHSTMHMASNEANLLRDMSTGAQGQQDLTAGSNGTTEYTPSVNTGGLVESELDLRRSFSNHANQEAAEDLDWGVPKILSYAVRHLLKSPVAIQPSRHLAKCSQLCQSEEGQSFMECMALALHLQRHNRRALGVWCAEALTMYAKRGGAEADAYSRGARIANAISALIRNASLPLFHADATDHNKLWMDRHARFAIHVLQEYLVAAYVVREVQEIDPSELKAFIFELNLTAKDHIHLSSAEEPCPEFSSGNLLQSCGRNVLYEDWEVEASGDETGCTEDEESDNPDSERADLYSDPSLSESEDDDAENDEDTLSVLSADARNAERYRVRKIKLLSDHRWQPVYYLVQKMLVPLDVTGSIDARLLISFSQLLGPARFPAQLGKYVRYVVRNGDLVLFQNLLKLLKENVAAFNLTLDQLAVPIFAHIEANKYTPIMMAARRGEIALLSVILDFLDSTSEATRSAVLDHVSPYGETALSLAAEEGQAGCLGLLLKHGAKLDANDASQCGEAIYQAAYEQEMACVKLLLEHGANPDASYDGTSCLFNAAFDGNGELCQILIEHGASRTLPSDSGHLPIHAAMQEEHTHLYELLQPNSP